MIRASVSGQFIDGARGPIFVLLRQPRTAPSGCVLVVPPFAEEMNKCRRMLTETALGLAEQGLATVIPDLYGTGDSGGDFADGSWATWQGDLGAATRWSAAAGHPVTGLLAVRLGAALAIAGLESGELPGVARTVLWQPVFDGGRFLAQFLRLRTAAALMEDRKETLADLRAQLADGRALEVAGYSLAGQLTAELEAVKPPQCLPAACGSIAWLEVVREAGSQLPEPSSRVIAATRDRGAAIDTAGILGEPFWSSTEIVVNDVMVDRTLLHLGGRGRIEGP